MPASSSSASSLAASNGMGLAATLAARASAALSMGFPPNSDPFPACPIETARVTTRGEEGLRCPTSGTCLPASRRSAEEEFTQLLRAPAVRIERIVSHGHASPPGFWYDQA